MSGKIHKLHGRNAANSKGQAYFFLSMAVVYCFLGIDVFYSYYGLEQQYNADGLGFAYLYKYVTYYQHAFTDWLFPTAGMYLDAIIYFLARSISADVHSALALSASMQALLTGAALSFVAGCFYSDKLSRQIAFVVIPLLLALSVCAGGSFAFLGIVNFHYSTLVFYFCVLAVVIQNYKTDSGLFWPCCLWLLCLIGYLDDSIFLLWIIAPLVGFCLVDWFLTRRTRSLALCGLVISSFVAAKIAFVVLQLYFPSSHGSIQPTPRIGRIFKQVWPILQMIGRDWGTSIISVALVLCGLWGFVHTLYKDALKIRSAKGLFLSYRVCFLVFLLWAVGCNILGVASTRYVSERYLLPGIVALPLVGSVLFFVHLLRERISFRFALFGILVVMLALAASAYHYRLPVYSFAYVQKVEQLMDRYRLHQGAANYWYAFPVNLFADPPVPVSAMLGNQFRITYGASPKVYSADGYDFFLVEDPLVSGFDLEHSLKPQDVVTVNGMPDKIERVTDLMAMYIYSDRRGRLPSIADMYLNTWLFAPPESRPDQIIYQRQATDAGSTFIREMRYVIRHGKAYGVFVVNAPVESLLNKKIAVATAYKENMTQMLDWWGKATGSPTVFHFFGKKILGMREHTLVPILVGPYESGAVIAVRIPETGKRDPKVFVGWLDGKPFTFVSQDQP